MSFKKLFSIFALFTISLFAISANALTESEWNKALKDAKSSTIKYSVNGYMDKLNIGNVSGSLKLAGTQLSLNSNISISSSIDMILESVMGDTVSGEYNVYASWTEGDEITLNEISYTEKNAKEYKDITDNYLLKSVMKNINSSLGNDSEDIVNIENEEEKEPEVSLAQVIKDIKVYKNYKYEGGKYKGSFCVKEKGEVVNVSVTIGFSSKKLSTLEIEAVDASFTNPITSDKTNLRILLKCYVYNVGKTTIVRD